MHGCGKLLRRLKEVWSVRHESSCSWVPSGSSQTACTRARVRRARPSALNVTHSKTQMTRFKVTFSLTLDMFDFIMRDRKRFAKIDLSELPKIISVFSDDNSSSLCKIRASKPCVNNYYLIALGRSCY